MNVYAISSSATCQQRKTGSLGPNWQTPSIGLIPPLRGHRGARLNSQREQPTIAQSNERTESGRRASPLGWHVFGGGGPVPVGAPAETPGRPVLGVAEHEV